MQARSRTTTTPVEAVAVVAICFGLMIVQSLSAVAAGFPSGEFTDAGTFWLVGLEVVLGAAALSMLHVRGFGIGSLYPEPTLRGTLIGLALYPMAAGAAMMSAAPFASMVATQPIESMLRDSVLSASAVIALAVVNGAFEEVFLLGFLVRGLRGFGMSTALGVSLLVRLLYHLYQGPLGALWVLVFGLVLSLYFMRSDKLWPPVFAHMLADIVPFV